MADEIYQELIQNGKAYRDELLILRRNHRRHAVIKQWSCSNCSSYEHKSDASRNPPH